MPNSKSLRKLFNLNGFPTHVFYQLVRHFQSTISSNPNHLSSQFPRKSSIFAFLSLVHIPFRFALNLYVFAVCGAAYLHLNIRFVFCSSTRISSFFPFKDKVPKFFRSGVVYLFKYGCCSASYLGQTTRHLHTRVSEHLAFLL